MTLTFARGEVAARLRFDLETRGPGVLDDLVARGQRLIQPRAAFDVASIEDRGEETVAVGGSVFQSRILRQNLERTDRVFPYLITIGPELEQEAAAQGDLLAQYYLEEIGNMALEAAAQGLAAHLEARFGLACLSSMSPGSLEDWPITEQTKLFALFGDTERLVGIRLTDSLLMLPRKSISGLLFPSDEAFVSCRLCERKNCPGRKAGYDPGGESGEERRSR